MSYRLVKSFYPTGSFNPDTEQAYEFVTGSSATDYTEFGTSDIPLDFINNNNPYFFQDVGTGKGVELEMAKLYAKHLGSQMTCSLDRNFSVIDNRS
jgi:hypothetical protein